MREATNELPSQREANRSISISVSLDHGRISDVSVLSTGSQKADRTWNDLREPECFRE